MVSQLSRWYPYSFYYQNWETLDLVDKKRVEKIIRKNPDFDEKYIILSDFQLCTKHTVLVRAVVNTVTCAMVIISCTFKRARFVHFGRTLDISFAVIDAVFYTDRSLYTMSPGDLGWPRVVPKMVALDSSCKFLQFGRSFDLSWKFSMFDLWWPLLTSVCNFFRSLGREIYARSFPGLR